MNGVIIDIVFIAIASIFGIRGAIKGFWKMLFGFLGLGATVVFYLLFAEGVNYFFEETLGLYRLIDNLFSYKVSGGAKVIINGIIIFVILRLFGVILSFIFNKIFNIGILKPVNRLGGFALGAIRPIIIVILISLSISKINIGGIFNEQIDEFLQDSIVVSKIYQFSQENLNYSQIVIKIK